MNSRLYRSRTDHMLAGVCGGLGRYLGVDSTWIRLFFLLLALGNGIGVMLYLILWVIIPYAGEGETGSAGTVIDASGEMAGRVRSMGDDVRQAVRTPNPQAGIIIGAALIILGVVYLVDNLHIYWLPVLPWLRFSVLWPLLLVFGGLILIFRRTADR